MDEFITFLKNFLTLALFMTISLISLGSFTTNGFILDKG